MCFDNCVCSCGDVVVVWGIGVDVCGFHVFLCFVLCLNLWVSSICILTVPPTQSIGIDATEGRAIRNP